MNSTKTRFTVYDLLLLFVGFVGLFNVFLLARNVFSTPLSLSLAFLFTVATFIVIRPKVLLSGNEFSKFFYIILVVGLLLRVPPFLYLAGGQDQGTYVSMSKQYELNKRLYLKDRFRETLTEPQKKIYDEYGNYMMPSFEKWNRPGSEYTMKFYPLHPSFLSNFGYLFGSSNCVYSLTFFSLISMINIYLIVWTLSKSKTAALIALSFVVLNPLHVFFSKMPVGEITALALATSAFYFLVKFLDTFDDKRLERSLSNKLYLLVIRKPAFLYLSLLMFFNFMFVRMTFFMHMILFCLLVPFVFIFIRGKILRVYLFLYALALFLLLLFSYRYYARFLTPLYDLVFNSTLVRGMKQIVSLFNLMTEDKILFFLFVCLLLLTAVVLARFFLEKGLSNFQRFFYFLTLLSVSILFVYAVYCNVTKFLQLGFEGVGAYERWGISKHGLDSIKNIVLFSITNHISLVGIILYLLYFFYAALVKKVDMKLFISFVVFSFFLIFYSINLKYMRYDYYNSRYYLTEVVPAFIVFASLFIFTLVKSANIFLKLGGYLSIALINFYYLFFSLVQLLGPEMVNNHFYNDLVSLPGNSMYILLNEPEESKYINNFNMYVFAPLKYYFNQKTIVISSKEAFNDQSLKDLLDNFDHVYVISNYLIDPSYGPPLVKMGKLELTYSHYNNGLGCGLHNYEFLDIESIKEVSIPESIRCITLPNAYYTRVKEFALYELEI